MVVHHGVDHSLFYPKEKHPKDRELFVYGLVSTNKYRKMIPRVIEAYSRLPINLVKTRLFLYCPPIDREGYDLPSFTSRYKIQSYRIKYPANLVYSIPTPKFKMIDVYSLMDVFVSASSGESFSLPHLEASACMKPIISIDIPVTREILGDAYIPVSISEKLYMEWGDMLLCNIEEMKDAMLELYNNDKKRRRLGELALERSKIWTWERSREELEKVLEKI